MNDLRMFADRRLRGKKYFYSFLKEEHTSNKDYISVCNVTVGDYHDLYLETAVL